MLDRRTIIAFFAATGAANTLLPGVLWAQIQPGTRKLTIEMVREAARLAGLNWTDQECQELLDSLSSFSRHAEGIDKPTLTNASPLPIHFDPRPPGIAQRPLPPAVFRLEDAPPQLRRPQNLEALAFWPLTHLAQLLQSRQVSSVELTRMYLDRLARYNGQLNCVVTITDARALAEAAAADKAIAAGKYLGILHGIPYGVKDIIAADGVSHSLGRATPRSTDVRRGRGGGATPATPPARCWSQS